MSATFHPRAVYAAGVIFSTAMTRRVVPLASNVQAIGLSPAMGRPSPFS